MRTVSKPESVKSPSTKVSPQQSPPADYRAMSAEGGSAGPELPRAVTAAEPTKPPPPTAQELRQKHPELFNTKGLSTSEWWAHRWNATSDVGRVAAVGAITAFLAALLLSCAWIVHNQLSEVHTAEAIEYQEVVLSLLQLHDAVRAERLAAATLAASVWAAATPAQVAGLAPPSATAVPGAAGIATNFTIAARKADQQLNSTVTVLQNHISTVSAMLSDGDRVPGTAAQFLSEVPSLSAGDRLTFASRGTRNPALTRDDERQRDLLRAALFDIKSDRNVEGYASWPGASFAPPDVSLSQLHFFSLADHRAAIYPTLSILPTEAADAYIRVERHILRLATRAAFASRESLVAQMVQAAIAGLASELLADAYFAASDLLDPAFQSSASAATYAARAVTFVGAVDGVDYMTQQLAPGILDSAALLRFRLNFGRLDHASEFHQLRATLLSTTLAGPDLSSDAAVLTAVAQDTLADRLVDIIRTDYAIDEAPAVATPRYMAVTLFAASTSVLLLLIVLVEQRHYAAILVSSARDRVMEQTIRYVSTVGDAVRHFDLEKAQRATFAESRTATTTQGLSVVHNRLERCVASLLYVAPTLSPLLFPERSHSAARYYSIVRRSTPSGSGGGLVEQATALATAGMDEDGRAGELLVRDAVESEGLDESIADRVRPHVDRRFACFLFADMSSLFEYSTSTESLDIAAEYTPIIAAVVEEAVVLHGGVFHSLNGHTFMGSWNVATDAPVPDICEAAARAAYMLSARLNIMRRDHAAFGSRLTVSIAITAGRVRFGIYNVSPDLSVVHVTGPPLLRATPVLRANYHHHTAISVDDVAADRLATRGLPSKPIELLSTAMTEIAKDEKEKDTNRNNNSDRQTRRATETTSAFSDDSGRAHELISLARHRDPDLSARLAEYKAAFALYQRGYQAEALKGFRRYTKLYGYDGSVERIQSLIMA